MNLKSRIQALLAMLPEGLCTYKRVVLALSCVVAVIVSYILILPAMSLDKFEAIRQGGIGNAIEEAVEDETQTVDSDAKTEAESTAHEIGEQAKASEPLSLTFESDDYTVAIEGKSADLSDSVSVAVEEIDKNNKDQKARYESLYDDALKAVKEEKGGERVSSFAFAKFYDISLVDGETAVDPDSSVDVTISYEKALQKELAKDAGAIDPDKVRIIHFAEDKKTGEVTPEVLDPESVDITVENDRMAEASFTADSFSVFAVVYETIRKTVISASGDTYEISVSYGEDAKIPEGAELDVREISEKDSEYAKLHKEAEDAFAAKYEESPDHLVTFDISIMNGDKEVEPAEGSEVTVDVRLKKDLAEEMLSAASEDKESDEKFADDTEAKTSQNDTDGFEIYGTGIWLNTDKVGESMEVIPDSVNMEVVHHTEDEGAVVLENVECSFEEDSIEFQFVTDAFSSYSFGGDAGESGQNTRVYNLSSLANLKVGDSVYFINSSQYEIRNVSVEGGAELSNRGDSNHRVLEIYKPCTFEIYNKNNAYERQIVTVTDRTHTPYSDTIETVDNNDIGITLSLFDYDLDNQLNEWWNRTYDGNFKDWQNKYTDLANYYLGHGINNGHALKFWAGGPTYTSVTNHPEYNAWLGDSLGTTIVDKNNMSTVDGKTYPKLTNGESLQYLFEQKSGTDKEYYAANHLFSEEDGYYVYNSGMTSDNQSGHYAYFNKETGDFEVYDKTYYYTKDGKQFPIGFFPFTQLDENAVKNGDLSSNQYPNHHFGMSMSVDFDIPEDKLDPNDNHITFEFSGDDDMWVFVDGKLVLDIGGIHQPIGGTVDFTTGTVTYKDKNGNTITANAYSPDLNTLTGNRGTAVNSYGTHTLQIFYLERGGGDSNCMIKFNTIPYKRIKFDKIDAQNDRVPGAVFKLYRDEECTQALMIPRSKTEGGQTINYYEEATSTSTADGYVIFDKVPVGTYYMKEVEAPEGYDLDGKVYTAVVTATRVGDEADDNYATIYWKNQNHLIGDGIINNEAIPVEVTKKWVKAGTSEEAAWPEGYKIGYKIVKHTYLESEDDGSLSEIPGVEETVFTAADDSLLTRDHQTHVVESLPKVGTWKSPVVVTSEMAALGIAANTEYPVVYKYSVEEDPDGSVLPADSQYTLLPVQAELTEDQDITVGGDTKKGTKALLKNEVTELEVIKNWSDGNENHEDYSVTVQLYRMIVKNDTPVIPDEPDDETISILVNANWQYEDGTSAAEGHIPRSGKIVAQISDGENSWTVELTDANNWTATKSGLPKQDASGKNITYTVTYLQQQTTFPGATNVKSIVVTQPNTVTGANGKVTLNAVVNKPEPVITNMTVPFNGTWIDKDGKTVTPPDNATITAVDKNEDGSVAATVVLNKANGWKSSATLPCSSDYDTFKYTVEYSATGDYVTGVGGTTSFSGQGSTVNATGLITKPDVADGKMAIQVVANGIVATGSDAWQIQINQTVHRVNADGSDNWDKNQYNFPDGILKGTITSSTISNMNVKDSSNQTIRYKMHVQAEHITKGTISVIDPSGKVLSTQSFTNGWNGDLYFNAAPGTFTVRIDGENANANATTKTTQASKQTLKTAVRGLAAPLKAAASTQTFDDDISQSGLKLPADADPVGEPVVLKSDADSAKAWRHLWENLPVTDSEGNTYYYYVKEVSATTGGDVVELGASYEYGYADAEKTRIHTVNIENTPTLRKTNIQIVKKNEDGEFLEGVPFTLWVKGGSGADGGEYAEVDGCIDVLTSKDGAITFSELSPGDYKITEGTPLAGYLALPDEIAFTIGQDGKVTGFEDTDLVKLTGSGDTFTFNITNEQGAELPHTGGIGTGIFYILGTALIAAAALLMKRRRAA